MTSATPIVATPGRTPHRHGEQTHDQQRCDQSCFPTKTITEVHQKIAAHSGREKNTAANVANDAIVAIAGAKSTKNTLGTPELLRCH
ncbi:hypothetical protein [Mycobacterium lepromatosis]|uniref:hypothetical protein n=1 Tax=Mycobacterium lepromatosis TaxID=480418 RepID=UPI000B036B9D|nr:hypothetical protein [Mycobacterium lepromatosis]